MTLNVIEFLLYIINIACFPFFKYDKSSNININIKQTKHCVVLLKLETIFKIIDKVYNRFVTI